MAKLYGDEDFDHPVIEALRRLGHDVLTVQNAGKGNPGIADDEVLSFAVAEGRAVLTFNRRDFIRLHHQNPAHRGIVVGTRDADVAALTARIHQTIASCPNLDGRLLRITRPQTA